MRVSPWKFQGPLFWKVFLQCSLDNPLDWSSEFYQYCPQYHFQSLQVSILYKNTVHSICKIHLLKGFFDKILLKNFAYESAKYGIKGLLTNIKVAKIITTAEAPKFLLHISGFGFTIKKANLGGIGIKKSKWIHFSVKMGNSDEKRKRFLEKVKKFMSN